MSTKRKKKISESCTRFGVSLQNDLLDKFDKDIEKRGYTNRSEAIRDLIRGRLVDAEWDEANQDTAGALVLVYDHHQPGLSQKLTHHQHEHHAKILSTLHAHLDHDNCIEVVLLRGQGSEIRALADHISSTKNVKLGKFVPATLGKRI